ncbi:unnamed protein product [Kuraishia capsulata CBS 1993]|uniref:Elongator complex protein 2 n=1 Tax=Kuraishia capsulata CBS 1993 TaxID=1382522 RepID=W6MJI6_9ASCO|nr:uncharacterized protein KUCA_T00002109001 [Kuraishia capsulata CBS 1993]CDK26138.1 unnamed protein product [Kuraishia capsulata CBS 1993]
MVFLQGIFVGANKELNSTSYSTETGLLVYGAGRTLAVWNPTDASNRILGTLKGHTAEVTCVRWLNSKTLLSGSEDHTVKVWSYNPDEEADDIIQRFKLTKELNQHTGSLITLETLPGIFATGAADGQICLFSGLELAGKFTVNANFYPLALSLLKLNDGYILFVGGTNKKLYVYSFGLENDEIINLEQKYALEGHEDWIKTITVKQESEGEYLIATGSQDRHIRLWKLNLDDKIDDSDKDTTKLRLLSNKQYKFEVGSTRCSISFDTILMGHEDWISTLVWHPTQLTLLSSSADTSVIIWEPDTISGVWVARTRLGELSIKGASTATGASGGFWSAQWIFGAGSQFILTHGKTGSWRLWKSSESTDSFEQLAAVTGATRAVTDLSWSQNGEYLLTTSLDQTTRLFAQSTTGKQWHEFARPQIHGYDMVSVASMHGAKFVSAGDEKIIRVFEEPKSVALMLERLCDVHESNVEVMPQSASLPVLGLSNKAETDESQMETNGDDDEENGPADENGQSFDILNEVTAVPLEDHLQRHTLWPEVEKLYGHGYEITTLAVSPDQKLVASACRSNSVAHSVIRIFQTSNWQPLAPLNAGHELTITRLKFSPDSKYLLSVSRDRQLSVWVREEGLEFRLLKLQKKAHTRILWDCAWLPQTVTKTKFFTASRDKTVKLWKIIDSDLEIVSSVKLADSVTAIAVLDRDDDGKVILAAGLDNGSISIFRVDPETGDFSLQEELINSITPALRVSRLSFRPSINGTLIELAAASDDTTTRIYSVETN